MKEYIWRKEGSELVSAFPNFQDMVKDIYNTASIGDRVYIGASTKFGLDLVKFDLSEILESIELRLKESCDFLDDWDISSITKDRKEKYQKAENNILEEIKNYIREINEVPPIFDIEEELLYEIEWDYIKKEKKICQKKQEKDLKKSNL